VKAVGGILSGIVLALLLVLVVSIITYLMNVAYDQQLTQESYVNDFISSPKAFQVGPSTIVSNGPLDVRYAIYPNGQVKNLSQPFDGRVDLFNLLNGDPWVYVVLSNGQAFNISRPQSSASSNISLLSLESQVPYYADYPLNPWNISTYQQIMTKGLERNPAHWPSLQYANNSWMEYGYGDVVVIPVHNVNGWLNFTASIPAWWNYGVGILFLNESGINEPENNEIWTAIVLGFINYTFQYNVTPLYSSHYLPYSFQNNTLPKSNYYTLHVAIHFQEGQPAELYVWWLNGSKWVPIWLETYKANATGDIWSNYTWVWPTWWCSTPGLYSYGSGVSSNYNIVNYSLLTTSFPAYLYTEFSTEIYWSVSTYYNCTNRGGQGYGGTTLWYGSTLTFLEPITLTPGSNIMIVPTSYGTLVYNITTTI
jgi:hypothetical protein